MVFSHFVALFLMSFVCDAARILGVFPSPSISHQVVFRRLTNELVKRGHHLVIVTPDPVNHKKEEFINLTEISTHEESYNYWESIFVFSDRPKTRNARANMAYVFKTAGTLGEIALSNSEVKKLINNKDTKFDLLILEWILYPAVLGLAHRFKCPVIGIVSLEMFYNSYLTLGVPRHPVISPDIFLGYVTPLTFWQRVDSVMYDAWFHYKYFYEHIKEQDKIARKIFGRDVPYVGDMENELELLFVNVYPTSNVRATLPNLIYIGGIHMTPYRKLPKALQNFLDNNPQGVIYFSLGSNIKSNTLDVRKRDILLQAFKELPYEVLWKWESDNLPGQPSNVKISKWLPQMDVLHHPNVKVFFTQGGLQSMDEAIFNEVPTLAMPFYADQDFNANNMVAKGIGRKLEFNDFTKEDVIREINELVRNPKYKENIARISRINQDQPMTSLERTVWWTEYVLRHNGTKHLKPPKIPLYQYWLLDVLAFFLVCFITSVVICYFIISKTVTMLKFLFKKKQD